MRVALFGDVHGNLPALETVLDHARIHGADEFWDLGDLTGYGPFPDEVVLKVEGVARRAVLGNYDRKVLRLPGKKEKWAARKDPLKLRAFEWAREQLSGRSLQFLASLPQQLLFSQGGLRFYLTHGGPCSRTEHLSVQTSVERLQELAGTVGADVICVAHSHRPFARKVGATWFVNPGSVGRPEGGDPRAVYVLLQMGKGQLDVTHYWLDYDRQRTAEEVRRKGLPDMFVRMFLDGVSLDGARAAEAAEGDGVLFAADELIAAARALSAQCVPLDQGHFLQVTRLALRLFDYLRPLHGWGEEERVLLQVAALLHDIGWADGQKGHHKSSMRRILEAPDLPLVGKERLMVALIARYHRRVLPRETHPGFGELEVRDRQRVSGLSCLLRIADGLDYSHDASVADLSVEVLPAEVRVTCSGEHCLERDIERGMKKGAECFKTHYHRELRLLWHRT